MVAKYDRFARSTTAALAHIKSIYEAGAVFASVAEGIDPTTSAGKLQQGIFLLLAEFELDRVRDGWRDATTRAVERGVHAHAPFGYRKRNGKGTTLEPDPKTARLVPDVFQRRAAGGGWTALADFLTDHAPASRGDHWTRRSVEHIIRNRAYLGEASYGDTVNPSAHPPLVTLDEFEAAQGARAPRPPRGEGALLSGIVRCAGCRHRLHAAKVGSSGTLVYRCKRRHASGVCSAPAAVTRARLDEYVTTLFLSRYGDVALEGAREDDTLSTAHARVLEVEAELAAYRDNTSIRTTLRQLGAGGWEAGLEARAQAVLSARADLERARSSAAGIDLGAALDDWSSLTTQEQRRLLTEGTDCVFLRRAGRVGRPPPLGPGRVRVFWRGEAPHDLPGPGVRVELRALDF